MSEIKDFNREKQILHFNYRNFVKIPQEVIDNGKDILEIYLKRNCLASLPIDIGKFTKLKHLYVNANSLQYLPKEIGDLKFLEILDLSQNELIEIPVEIGLLTFLKNLNLSQNKITQLPIELKNLSHLKILNLSSNKLTYFPEEIIELNHGFPTLGLGQSIEELIFDGNPLHYVPRSFGFLPNLKYLSMCKCNLLFLTGNLTENGPVLRFDGNSNLNYLPASILSPDIESFGCSTTAKLTNCWPAVSINYNGHYETLYFDQYLYKIINPNNIENLQPEDQVLSLVEISLRSLYKMKKLQKLQKLHNHQQLPKNMTRFLNIGPLSRCYKCQEYIFTSCCPLFFTSDRLGQNSSHRQKNGSAEIKIFCEYFCSTNCYYRFKNDLNAVVNFAIDSISPNVQDMLRYEIFDWKIKG